ncbi:g4702 [Coccomyxa elongata]
MAYRRRLKNKKPPAGWELIEEVIEDFESQLKEAVNEEHEGRRKNELTWKINRIHWEKNRFIYDLMYVRKVMSRELYEWLVREKVADGALISKWRKPGYEILCSMLAIQKGNHNFGTTSHCRVPMALRGAQQRITPDVQIGCISCASGDGKFGQPIWWNTPLDEDDVAADVATDARAGAEQHRAQWGQQGEDRAPTRKRAAPEEAAPEEDELPDEVRQRLSALRNVD